MSHQLGNLILDVFQMMVVIIIDLWDVSENPLFLFWVSKFAPPFSFSSISLFQLLSLIMTVINERLVLWSMDLLIDFFSLLFSSLPVCFNECLECSARKLSCLLTKSSLEDLGKETLSAIESLHEHIFSQIFNYNLY